MQIKEIENYIENVAKPRSDSSGDTVLSHFNLRHQPFALWAMESLPFRRDSIRPDEASVLDIGCGGGRNIANMLLFYTEVDGIDYSSKSVDYSSEFNRKAIAANRTKIFTGSVDKMPFSDNSYDIATAFETTYYWPDIKAAFAEIYRCLKDGGLLLIANETDKKPEKGSAFDIENLTVHSCDALSASLKSAGFTDIEIRRHDEKNWVVVTGKKS